MKRALRVVVCGLCVVCAAVFRLRVRKYDNFVPCHESGVDLWPEHSQRILPPCAGRGPAVPAANSRQMTGV